MRQTNSLKHAFPPGRQGEIRIELCSDGDNAFTLTVSDNGVGIPKDVDIHNTTSLGLTIVKGYAEFELGGTLDHQITDGTKFTVNWTL